MNQSKHLSVAVSSVGKGNASQKMYEEVGGIFQSGKTFWKPLCDKATARILYKFLSKGDLLELHDVQPGEFTIILSCYCIINRCNIFEFLRQFSIVVL